MMPGVRPRAATLALSRAFTLIEALIVVVVIGILSTLGIVSYRRWTQSTFIAEAHEMVANIRTAEESFRAENGGYLTVSNGLGPQFDYPKAPPGKSKTAWGAACATCVSGTSWQALAVQPSAPVAFGYSVVADNSGSAPGAGVIVSVGGQAVDLSSLAGQPWYVVEADGDIDGNGVFTKVYGLSSTNQLFVDNEGE